MTSRCAQALAFALLYLLVIPDHAAGEEATATANESSPQAFFVVVDEYELSQAAEIDASGKRVLEMIAEGHANISLVRKCAVTATIGVPTRASFYQHHTSSNPPVIVGTGMNILLEQCNSDVKLQLRYESKSVEGTEPGGPHGHRTKLFTEHEFLKEIGVPSRTFSLALQTCLGSVLLQ